MDGRDRASVATFFAHEPLRDAVSVELGEAVARHVRVRRLEVGDVVHVTDGRGMMAVGSIARIHADRVGITLTRSETVPLLPRLELLVPVADRDRMLWLAEKAAEFGVSVWQPVIYARSRSVSPRGEGGAFAKKVRLRMESALEQSGGAWLPEIRVECTLEAAVAACAVSSRLVLTREGRPLTSLGSLNDMAIAFGPEGGLDSAELEVLIGHAWRAASLGSSTLRFETAGIAAVAIVRAGQGD